MKHRNKSFFEVLDANSHAAVRDVVDWIQRQSFGQGSVSEFSAGADPFLIAYALTHGHTVVTNEKLAPVNTHKVKIPNVCQNFGVEYTDPFKMLRALRASFVLKR